MHTTSHVSGMDVLSIQLIRDSHSATHLTDRVARAVAEATHTLCLWAADPAVPDALVAERVTEAVGKVRDIAERVERQRAPRISEHTQEALAGALRSLQSFLSGSDDDDDVSFSHTSPNLHLSRQSYPSGGSPGVSNANNSASAGGSKPAVPNPLDPTAVGAAAADAGGGTVVQGGDGSFKRMGVKARGNLLLRTMTPVEKERAMMRACGYMRLLVCGVWLISSLMMLGAGVLAIEAFNVKDDDWQRMHSRDLLLVAQSALDALYPALLAENVDTKFTGVSLASQLLADLSTTRAIGKYSQDKMMMFDSMNHLYEFRAGTQDFSTPDHRVVSVLTPRHYAPLCKMNTSYPLKEKDDAGWMVKSFVVPQLTPYDCANDATTDGVFAEVSPPYVMYTPYVRTYRRNPARVCGVVSSGFQMSVAVTVDRVRLQNQLVTPSIFFGVEDYFSVANDVNGWWKRDLVVTLVCMDLVLLGALMLVAQIFTVPALQFRGHRAVFAVALTAASVVVAVVSLVLVDAILEEAAHIAHGLRIENDARCIASGFVSSVFDDYPVARTNYINEILATPLKDNLFFIRMDTGMIEPADMQSFADTIGVQDILLHACGQTMGVRGGYRYATFAQPGDGRIIVMVDAVKYDEVGLDRCKKLVIGMEFAVLVFALVVLYLSPLKGVPLVFASGSALLTHKLQLGLLRQLYFLLLAATLIGAVAGLNYYGDTLLKEAMTKNAGDLMEVLAVTNRAKTLVDVCYGSCGFSSYFVGMYFSRAANNMAQYLAEDMSLPYGSMFNWTNLYFGAQLVMARLPTVLHAMPSFYAPVVNESTNSIHAGSVVRDLAVAVDINETNGFVIERLNPTYGHAGGQYTFVSQSIGLAIVGCMLCVSFTLMEWAYSRLLRLSPSGWLAMRARCDDGKEDAVVPHAEGVDEEELSSEKKVARRRLLRALYVLSASLLLSCAVLISAGVMRGRMRASMEQHADEEMSRVVCGALERFETVGLGYVLPALTEDSSSSNGGGAPSSNSSDDDEEVTKWGDTNPKVMLYNLAVAVADAQDGLESSIAPYVRWRLLQEWPSFGSGRVRVIEGPGDIAAAGDVPTYSPGPLNYGTVPVCGSSEGTWLTPQLPQRKRYCFTEIPGGSMNQSDLPPRDYLLLFTEEDSIVNSPVEEAWWRLMRASIMVMVALCLAYVVLAWWFLLACDHHNFSPFVCGDLLTVQGAIPRFFRSVDMYIPVRFRKRWAMTTTFGILVVLLYYCASMQLLFQGVDTTRVTAVPVWTQQAAVESITKGAIMDAYNYVVAGQAISLTSLQNRATAVSTGKAGYGFLEPARQADLASNISGLRSALAALTELPSLRSTQLVLGGWDTYQTAIADQYTPYVTAQSSIRAYMAGLYECFSMYFSSDFVTADEANITSDADLRAKFIVVLDTALQLDDFLTQLFILDHVAVASYLSFDSSILGSNGASLNANWPFLPTNVQNPSATTGPLVTTTLRLGAYLLGQVGALGKKLLATSAVIYANAPSLLSVSQESVSGIQTTIPSACILFSTIYAANTQSMEKYYPPASLTTNIAAANALWSTQASRASEVQYVNNLTMQTLASKSNAAAIAAIKAYGKNFSGAVVGEMVTRKSTQLSEYMSRGVTLNNMHYHMRWEAYRALVQTQQSMLAAFVSVCVFYGVWLLASSLWFAMTRQQVVWWLRGSTRGVSLNGSAAPSSSAEERQPLAADSAGVDSKVANDQTSYTTASGSGSGSRNAIGHVQQDAHRRSSSSATAILLRYRHRRVLTIFVLLALLALVPVGLIYWFADHGVNVASANNGALSMGLRTIEDQGILDKGLRSVFEKSGSNYASKNAAPVLVLASSLTSNALRLAYTYMWRAWSELASGGSAASFQGILSPNASNMAAPSTAATSDTVIEGLDELPSQVESLLTSMEQVVHSMSLEVFLFSTAIPLSDLPDFHIGLGSYAVSILESITMTTTQAPNPSNPTGPPVTTTTFSYDDLMPLSTSYGTSAVYTYARYLFTTYTAQAQAATTLADFEAAVTTYRDKLTILDNVAESELMAWHVGVVAARRDGSASALDYGPPLSELLEASNLQILDDGSSEGLSAVLAIQAFFDPMLLIIGTDEHVATYFEQGDMSNLPTNQTAASTFVSMLTSAGIASTTLSASPTMALFQSLYAYNRDLAPLTGQLSSYLSNNARDTGVLTDPGDSQGSAAYDVVSPGPSSTNGNGRPSSMWSSIVDKHLRGGTSNFAFSPSVAPADGSGHLFNSSTDDIVATTSTSSLLQQANVLVAYSKIIMQAGVTGVEQYIPRQATRNKWIWQKEIYATVLDGGKGSYGDVQYLYWCIVWCGTCAMWIAAIALIYLMYGMELLV